MGTRTYSTLTLNLLNFLNGIIHLPFLELSIINFRVIKMRFRELEDGEPTVQSLVRTACICRLA